VNANWILSALQKRSTWTLDEAYRLVEQHKSDIRSHIPTIRQLACQAEIIVELGVRYGVSTIALMAGKPKRMVSYDINVPPNLKTLQSLLPGRWEFRQGDSRKVDIPGCDLLFIDTVHTAEQISEELRKHASQVRRWIAAHDTESFPEIRRPLEELVKSGGWHIVYTSSEDNGLWVLERISGRNDARTFAQQP